MTTRPIFALTFAFAALSDAQQSAVAERLRLVQVPPSQTELQVYAGLHAAAAKGYAADPNIADGRGETALGHARARRYGEMVGILQAAGAR